MKAGAGAVTDDEEVAYGSDTQEVSPEEKAFIDSENHTFDGIALEPYSPMRIIAAQAMGLHHGRVDAGGMEEFSRIAVYPGAQRDVCIVLWLCCLKDEHEIDMAARAPVSAAKQAIEWGVAHGLFPIDGEKFQQAFTLFFKIMTEIKESYGAPAQKKIPAGETVWSKTEEILAKQ